MSPSPTDPWTLADALEACAGRVTSGQTNDKPLRVLARNADGLFEVVPYHGQPYLAISYCWPSSTFHKLSTSNSPTPVLTLAGDVQASTHFSRFISQSALSYDPSLCVWVDFHCINQTDQSEKTAQVAIMQRIYTGAKITLIMLEDVGLYPEDRRALATPQATELSLPLARRVLSARWFSRAWCSQELVLSHHAHFYAHDLTQEGQSISIPSDTLWHIIDSARNRDTSILFFTQPRGNLPDIAMARSTCAWALSVIHHLGCSDDYDKVSLLCNLVRLVYCFTARPTAFNQHSSTIDLNVLRMANIIAIRRGDFSLLLMNHGRRNQLQGCLGFGWAGSPLDGDRASLVWAPKDFQVAKDSGIKLTADGLVARGCLARIVKNHRWQLHRDATGLHLSVGEHSWDVALPTHVHPSWTWGRDVRHLQDLLAALAFVSGRDGEDVAHHARIVFAYLLSIDYDLQPEPIPGDLHSFTRSLFEELISLKDIASAMSFIWQDSALATFSTIRLSEGSVLLASGNADSLSGRLLFQPYVTRPKLFSPPMVLTVNSMVLEERPSSAGVFRCIGCVRGLGMISEADGHAVRGLCVA
ncbi:heterokaryon incompatibility protein-domain-containing protein [Trametes polyzona]|nr:heterokaryon incompatibility protein-domain-containing protein [Trametes polyzona]